MLRTRKKFRFGKKRDGSAGRPPSLPYRIGDNDELPILDQQVQIVQDLFFPAVLFHGEGEIFQFQHSLILFLIKYYFSSV